MVTVSSSNEMKYNKWVILCMEQQHKTFATGSDRKAGT